MADGDHYDDEDDENGDPHENVTNYRSGDEAFCLKLTASRTEFE